MSGATMQVGCLDGTVDVAVAEALLVPTVREMVVAVDPSEHPIVSVTTDTLRYAIASCAWAPLDALHSPESTRILYLPDETSVQALVDLAVACIYLGCDQGVQGVAVELARRFRLSETPMDDVKEACRTFEVIGSRRSQKRKITSIPVYLEQMLEVQFSFGPQLEDCGVPRKLDSAKFLALRAKEQVKNFAQYVREESERAIRKGMRIILMTAEQTLCTQKCVLTRRGAPDLSAAESICHAVIRRANEVIPPVSVYIDDDDMDLGRDVVPIEENPFVNVMRKVRTKWNKRPWIVCLRRYESSTTSRHFAFNISLEGNVNGRALYEDGWGEVRKISV